jgi:uncharacterized membrane protein
MIAGMTYYQICMYFLMYSFGGWLVEVVYHAVKFGKIVNRGFLNGPVCPVYGFGMLAVLAAGNAMSTGTAMAADLNPFVLFLFGMVLATAVELIAGWALDRLFHARWWDYSKEPFNFHGYICLRFSIIWGLAIVLVVKVIHPVLADAAEASIPPSYGWWIMLGLYVLYLIDLIVTVSAVAGLNRRLKELDHIRSLMRKPSDSLSSFVGSTSLETAQRVQQGQVQAALARAEMKEKADQVREDMDLKTAERKAELDQKRTELEQRAIVLTNELTSHQGRRLLKAFPSLHHHTYEDLVEEMKKHIKTK